MDVVVSWPASGVRFWLDVTIRSPFARELTRPHLRPGAAALNGERDKHAHYGAAVTAFAMEPFGRMGAEALQAMAAMHRESCEFGRLRPGTGRASALSLRAFRADLEAAVVQHAAQASLRALGASTVQALGWASSPHRRAARPARAGGGDG